MVKERTIDDYIEELERWARKFTMKKKKAQEIVVNFQENEMLLSPEKLLKIKNKQLAYLNNFQIEKAYRLWVAMKTWWLVDKDLLEKIWLDILLNRNAGIEDGEYIRGALYRSVKLARLLWLNIFRDITLAEKVFSHRLKNKSSEDVWFILYDFYNPNRSKTNTRIGGFSNAVLKIDVSMIKKCIRDYRNYVNDISKMPKKWEVILSCHWADINEWFWCDEQYFLELTEWLDYPIIKIS